MIPSLPTPLAPWERRLIHAAYLFGLVVVGRVAAGILKWMPPASVLIALQLLAAAGGVMFVYLRWSARGRAGAPPAWFVTHVLWLMMSFLYTVAWAIGTAVFLFVAVVVVATFRSLAALAVYGPILVAALIALWFIYRMVRGYLDYLREYPAAEMLPR